MADTKITALTALTAADPSTDVLPIVDTSDTTMAASGTTKKISINNILGASGTATLASATITGNLTAGGNVGFGTTNLTSIAGYNALKINNATTGAILDLAQGDAYRMRLIGSTAGAIIETAGTNPFFVKVGGTDSFRIDAAGVFNWYDGAGGTRMTLNSTGLGVGTSPTGKLTIGTGAYVAGTLSGTSSLYSTVGQGLVVLADGLVVGTRTGSDRFILDTSGNVGIGVVPSAWVAGAKALQFGAYGSLAQSSSGNIELSFNSYNSGAGAYKYLQTDTASLYRASSVHSWFVAPSGTAGNAITFTQAMTLDANGNLILQSSATPATLTTNGQLTVNATSNTNLRFSYRGSDGVTRVANLTLA